MRNVMDSILNSVDSLLEWLATSLKTTTASYCDLEAVDNRHTLVTRDGSMVTVLQVEGVQFMVGGEEFENLHAGVSNAFSTAMSREGHGIQLSFTYDNETVGGEITGIFEPV